MSYCLIYIDFETAVAGLNQNQESIVDKFLKLLLNFDKKYYINKTYIINSAIKTNVILAKKCKYCIILYEKTFIKLFKLLKRKPDLFSEQNCQ